MERHQLTNETKQTGFRAGFFPGLIGINCERLQSTTRRLTFASSEHFLLIVLMITMGAGDHHWAGVQLPGVWPVLTRVPEDGAPASTFSATCSRRAAPEPHSGPGCSTYQVASL